MTQNQYPIAADVDVNDGQAGITTPTGNYGAGISSTTSISNTIRMGRFVPEVDQTVTKMSFIVSTAAGTPGDLIDIGIYDAASMVVLSSSGSQAGFVDTTGLKTVTIPTLTLKGGKVYYAAIGYGVPGSSPAFMISKQYGFNSVVLAWGGVPPALLVAQANTFPLSNAPALSGTPSACPLIMVS